MLEVRTDGIGRCGISRRTLLKAGVLGMTGLTLADVLRLRAARAAFQWRALVASRISPHLLPSLVSLRFSSPFCSRATTATFHVIERS